MATFKRINEQETRQVACYTTSTESADHVLTVGDVIGVNPATNLVTKCTDAAEVLASQASGDIIYIVAQGDAVTHKTGTGYKEYKISDSVTVSTDSDNKSNVVGFIVKDVTNIEF